MRPILRTAATFLVAALAFSCSQARAQQPPPAAPAPPKPADSGLTVSVPLRDLRELLGDKEKPDAAPVDVVFGAAAYTVEANDKSAVVTVATDLTMPNARWVLVPLGPADGVTSVTVDGQPASVVTRNNAVQVLIDARQKQAAKLAVQMQLPVKNRGGDERTLSLPLIPGPIGTMTLKVPVANATVRVAETAVKTEAAGAGTTATATLPNNVGNALVSWAPRDARPSRVGVQQFAHVIVDRGVVRYLTTLQYDVLRSPVDTLRVALPDVVEVTRVTGDALADTTTDDAAKPRVLTATLKEPTQGGVRLQFEYEQRLADDQFDPAAALLLPLDVATEQGFIGVEVRGNYELTPAAKGADRIDVAQLPDLLWQGARSPLRFGFRYDKPGAALTLALRPLQDLDVLIAMSDACEVSTTITPEGRVITKMILIVRNNQKSHLRVGLPEGATLWSAFVDDRPVNPAKDEKGNVLVPLRKSEAVEEDDEQNYMNKREQRRNEQNPGQAQQQMQRLQERVKRLDNADDGVSDLKPYDVELVYVSPEIELADRGELKLALPRVDVPIGDLAWGVFVPKSLRVVDATGNIREVDSFGLPFMHFAEAGLRAEQKDLAQALKQAAQQQVQAMEQLSAERAKAKGVLPVRIEIPLTGTLHRFEKLLVVDEMPAVELTYVRRP